MLIPVRTILSGTNYTYLLSTTQSQHMDLSVYIMCSTKLFYLFEPYHPILPDPDIEQGLMLLASNIPSYYLPDLNVKMPDMPLSRRILKEVKDLIYCELKHTLAYMLQHDDTDFYRNKEEFQWAQKDFFTHVMEATYR